MQLFEALIPGTRRSSSGWRRSTGRRAVSCCYQCYLLCSGALYFEHITACAIFLQTGIIKMPTVDGIGRPGQYGPEHNCAFVLVSGSSVTCSYKNRRHWHRDCNYLTTNVFLRRKCLEFPNKLIASQIFDNALWLFTRHWNVCRRLVSMKIFKENKNIY